LPNISALCDFIREAAKEDFAASSLLMSRTADSLQKWIHAKPLLNLSQDAVENVICSGCEENCYMPVERIRTHDDKIAYFVACKKRDDMGFIELNDNEVRPYKFDIMALCSLLAETLESVDNACTSIPNLLYKLGRCTIKGNGYTFFLALNLEDTRTIAHHPDYMNASNPIIISVNDAPPDISLPVVLLDALFFINQAGTLSIFPEAIAALYMDEAVADKNIFRKDSAVWLVAYQGNQSRIKHTKGCYYIQALLTAPNKAITALKLHGMVNKPDLPDEQHSTMSPDELESEGMAVQYDSPDDVIDLKVYVANLTTLDKQIADAESKGMTGNAERLKRQKTGIEEFIKKNTNIRGKSRKVPDSNEKARKAVLASIKTAIKNIGDALPELSLHLNAHLITGHTCKYTPVENLNWQV